MNCYLAYCYLNKYSKGFIKQRNSASAHGCFWQPHSDEKAVSGIPYKLHSKGNYDVQFFIELEVNLCNIRRLGGNQLEELSREIFLDLSALEEL